MKKIAVLIAGVLLAGTIYAQQLAQVTLAGGENLSYYSLLVDQNILIRITPDGKIMEWGNEVMANRSNYFAPKLQPYMGRVDYYGNEADSLSRGKVRSIGTCTFFYYTASEDKFKAGKIRMAGSLNFDYYSDYDNVALKGKIKNIGSLVLNYYNSFDEESLRGKLKTVGSTNITYFTPFDDKMIRGLVKTIGSYSFNWYNSLDIRGARGILKSGDYRQSIGGVWYILR
ncbi:MAG: hypothetical protein NTW29_02830 [Bacteroidetes bacterium]|nr:hypothetical protein [Bacteroidota bacterium]